MSTKRSSNEPMQSGGKKSRLESENEASNDIEENKVSNVIEGNEASNDIVGNEASNVIEENEASNVIEENEASNVIELNEASNVINEASNDIEENKVSNVIEGNEASNVIEENEASNVIEENEASNVIELNEASNVINEASNDIEENKVSNVIEGNEASNVIEENEASNDIEETVLVPIKSEYYPPEWIFCDKYDEYGKIRENKPKGMAGTKNIDLAISFYHSRYTREDIQGTSNDMNNYLRNAGALQLYKKDGITKYTIPGKEEVEYNGISCTTEKKINEKNSGIITVGHSERLLMRDVLDDLIEADSGKPGIPPRPSDYKDDTNTQHDYKVLNNLTEKASEYKQYLKSKGLIVKMWSERKPCADCATFIKKICPEGSQYGYIVWAYMREFEFNTLHSAFEKFVKAKQKYVQSQKNV
ncbi:uncharacterized protein LOC128986172 isoform X3 [Macrosteles quadrilineatus]|uniref:uncharacterized protein LOC128986172 isoform X3 n=1 Tax=Macrosteles quadrilineatus TaxID=74068 RepID=UPI0023E2900A|nr:uncharacterized protein LOC128986172 isoform X3 [Macrosteles quadrilineatus]